MTTRVLSWIAIAIAGTIPLGSGLATILMFGGGGTATAARTATTAPPQPHPTEANPP